jgi:hypothetical protein
LERQAFLTFKGNEMNDIAKQQEEMFFIATDWDKTDNTDPLHHHPQVVGSSVKEAVEKHHEGVGSHPKYVYVVSKQLVAQAPNYI